MAILGGSGGIFGIYRMFGGCWCEKTGRMWNSGN
jgi:hypothetical protein